MAIKFVGTLLEHFVLPVVAQERRNMQTTTYARRATHNDTEIRLDPAGTSNPAPIETPSLNLSGNIGYFHGRFYLDNSQSSATNYNYKYMQFRDANRKPVVELVAKDGRITLQVISPVDGTTVVAEDALALPWDDDHINAGGTGTSSTGTLDFVIDTTGSTVSATMYRNGFKRLEVLNAAAVHDPVDIWDFNCTADMYLSEVVVDDTDFTLGYSLSTVKPAADGHYTDFVGSYTALLNDDDADRMSANAANQRFTWQATDLAAGLTDEVKFMGVYGAIQTMSSGPANLRQIIRTNNLDYQGTPVNFPVATAGKLTDLFPINPGGSPWTVAEINAIEIGFETV